jgi:hypothetical protein
MYAYEHEHQSRDHFGVDALLPDPPLNHHSTFYTHTQRYHFSANNTTVGLGLATNLWHTIPI